MRQGPKVLLIGDDARMAKWRETFGRAALVAQAEDLPQALQKLAGDEFGVVFADWRFHCGT